MDDPISENLIRRTFRVMLVMILLQAVLVVETYGVKAAVEAMRKPVPKQSTEIPITINNVATTTTVETEFREPPYQDESEPEWDARHIATCSRVRQAWGN